MSQRFRRVKYKLNHESPKWNQVTFEGRPVKVYVWLKIKKLSAHLQNQRKFDSI